jgi:hypothetical protein
MTGVHNSQLAATVVVAAQYAAALPARRVLARAVLFLLALEPRAER